MWVDEESGSCGRSIRRRDISACCRDELADESQCHGDDGAGEDLYECVLLPDGDVWWEGKTAEPPESAIDWTGKPWTPGCGRLAAHANSRFTAPMENNPHLDPAANDPRTANSAIIFGGR